MPNSTAPERAYFDYAASAPLRKSAKAAIDKAFKVAGNPHAVHQDGQAAARSLGESREKLAELIDCDPSEIIFTAGGTEANNLAVYNAGRFLKNVVPNPDLPTVRFSAFEHPSVTALFSSADQERRSISADQLRKPAELIQSYEDHGWFASIMKVNNELGAVVNLEPFAKAENLVLHCDAVQAFGHLPKSALSFKKSGVDLMTVSAHKLGGPIGVGALVVRRDLLHCIAPRVLGGGQENNFRSGTVPFPLVAGFAAAATESIKQVAAQTKKAQAWDEQIIKAAQESAADFDFVIANPERRLAGLLALTLKGNADEIQFKFDNAGFSISLGAACSAGVYRSSPSLAALKGADFAKENVLIRISTGHATTDDDVARLCEFIKSFE